MVNIHPFPTRQQIHEINSTRKENIHIFHEVLNIERNLIQQIVEAIEPAYLQAMRNRITGQYTGSVYQILNYLWLSYGRITPVNLLQHEN